MINKFRYKKPAKESPNDCILKTVVSDGGDTLKTNKSSKTIKVFDNDLDAIRISDRINNNNEDMKGDNQQGVLDENIKKQLHVRILSPSNLID